MGTIADQHTEQGRGASFNEEEWLRLLFLLNDTEQWLQEMHKGLFGCLPVADKRKFLRKTYYLTASALAHILERHYHRIPRHPGAAKFTIPVPDILHYIREGSGLPAEPISGCGNYKRVVEATAPIGFDHRGQPTFFITILTETGGRIITAFPGVIPAPAAA
jgi:hypothetical protein